MNKILDKSVDLKPVFVISSLTRTGTTLVQRLICSSDNGICFGEKLFKDLTITMDYVFQTAKHDLSMMQYYNDILEKVSNGDVNTWMPELYPEMYEYLEYLFKSLYSLSYSVQNYANSIKKPIWGAKNPKITANDCYKILTMFQGSKIIYLYRDIYSVLKSQKARKFVNNESELIIECNKWTANISDIHIPDIYNHKRLMVVNYDTITNDFDTFVTELETFTGLTNINREVIKTKVNTFDGEKEQGYSKDKYIAPEKLTDREMLIIKQLCGKELKRFYPHLT